MKYSETVVFDFDGTLVSKDTGYEFNKWLIQRSALRTALLFLFVPIMLPLICSSRTRKLGFNIAFFIGTALQRQSLFHLRDRFIDHYFNGLGAIAYAEGIQELQNHQNNGRSVAIISGCPRWLLQGVVKHLGIKQVTIIGSELRVKNKALLFYNHCYGENKLSMARAYGLDPDSWIAGYSDSTADIPMLRVCSHKILVNVSEKNLDKFRKHLQGSIQMRAWV